MTDQAFTDSTGDGLQKGWLLVLVAIAEGQAFIDSLGDPLQEDSLHVLVALAEGVPEDAVEAQPGAGQDVLPAPEQYPHTRPPVPALLQHVCMHVRVGLHNGVRPGPPPLYSLDPGQSCLKQWQLVEDKGVGRPVTTSICGFAAGWLQRSVQETGRVLSGDGSCNTGVVTGAVLALCLYRSCTAPYAGMDAAVWAGLASRAV